MSVENFITDNLDIWTSAVKTKSASSRGSSNKLELYGIKKLRELILGLAVSGKLVDRDFSHEPVEQLIEQISSEKELLVKNKKIKKQKVFPAVEEKIVQSFPEHWKCTVLGDIGYWAIGSGIPTAIQGVKGEEVLVCKVSDMNLDGNDKFIKSTTNTVSKNTVESKKLKVHGKSTVIFPKIGGAIATNKRRMLVQATVIDNNCLGITPYSSVFDEYLYIYLCSIDMAQYQAGTSVPALSQATLELIPFGLPPIEEQRAIVKKVNELLALCDHLESKTESSIEAHKTLVETLLATLTNAKDADELNESWQRISEHFDTLFTTEDSIEQLKQTILQLAVMGKLVKQDPNDEPASALLERIAEEKEQLIKDKKIKKQKELMPISQEEMGFELPSGWVWCKFGSLAEFINGDRGKNYPNKSEYVSDGVPWINTGHIEKNGTLSKRDMNFITPEKFDSLRSGKVEKGDLVYCLRGATFGKTAFVEPFNFGAIASSLMIIRLHKLELNKFVYWYLISPFGRSQIFRFDNGSAQPNLSANSVKLYAFPLPPIAEQIRISEKINHLFEICDSLKSRVRRVRVTQKNLSDSISSSLVN
ncbi:restriction endonuclease subunit S [Thalassotalea ponticola]|uniref:restriction endonuclease subunit S n=1 Tax=Thalassotalea ponticola TaxID=1523392 RepID=UPI0025B53748|nr:restriction endonuclease subunit S [Thalassotalea ponticola]MDN3651497.1 restriction endonuclease subunit S [Thalassotalea ponticola]